MILLFRIVAAIIFYFAFLCLHSYIISVILGLSEHAQESMKLTDIWNSSNDAEKILLIIVLIPYAPILLLAIPYEFIMKFIRK